MEKGWEKLKKNWEDNPLQVIAVVGMASMGAAKLIDAISSASSRRAYARQVDYKVKNRR